MKVPKLEPYVKHFDVDREIYRDADAISWCIYIYIYILTQRLYYV